MTTASTASDGDARARKNVRVLVAAQAFLGAQMPIHFGIGGLSGQILAADKCWATLPISMTVLTTMLVAPFLSGFMQRHGRRAGFLVGAAGGATGGLLAALSLYVGSFALLLAGSAGIGYLYGKSGLFPLCRHRYRKPGIPPEGHLLRDGGGARLGHHRPAARQAHGGVHGCPLYGRLPRHRCRQRPRRVHLRRARHPETRGGSPKAAIPGAPGSNCCARPGS